MEKFSIQTLLMHMYCEIHAISKLSPYLNNAGLAYILIALPPGFAIFQKSIMLLTGVVFSWDVCPPPPPLSQ